MLSPVSIIHKKRDGHALTTEEINYFIEQFTKKNIPDYQMSAFLMSVFFRSMNAQETAALTQAMYRSGKNVSFSKSKKPTIDKHSTGGIGDKPTLILAPLLASCGIAVPTIAGRGLAHTGGTVDKLEAIPGFKVSLPLQRFQELVEATGLCFLSQSEEICPADKAIYALRDVTATVDSLPLIVASIMSKKLAEGSSGFIFDVKYGSGAFMKTPKAAITLAKALVNTAKNAGRSARALVTDMSQPLGHAAGHAIEINECVNFLRRAPHDHPIEPRLYELTMSLAEEMLLLGRKKNSTSKNRKLARKELQEALHSGRAYAKFLEIISLQGGDTEAVDNGLPLAPCTQQLQAKKPGFIGPMDAEAIGLALVELGGGRKKSSDTIDPSVGFAFAKKTGDAIKKGETIASIYAKNNNDARQALELLTKAIPIHNKKLTIPQLIIARI